MSVTVSATDVKPADKDAPVPETRDRKDSAGKSDKKQAIVKVGMLGDPAVGKTSLATKYTDNEFKQDYIQTLGVLPHEKKVEIKNAEITFSVFDLGGDDQFLSMLPVVCNDAVALLFVFDLTRKPTLGNLREWYQQARTLNKTAKPFLIGTKYDAFCKEVKKDDQLIITRQVIFKLVISKVFNVKLPVKQITAPGDPIVIYDWTDPAVGAIDGAPAGRSPSGGVQRPPTPTGIVRPPTPTSGASASSTAAASSSTTAGSVTSPPRRDSVSKLPAGS